MWHDKYVKKHEMRKIDKIIIHCSATREGQDIDAATIDEWHKERGWSGIGYHYVIKLDGTIEYGRMVDKIGAHCKGHNKHSIGVCYIGGCDEDMQPRDTRTSAQKTAIFALLMFLTRIHKGAVVHGHRDFSNKACPSFDASKEYKNI